MKILRIIPSMDPKQGGPCQGIRNAIPEMQKLGVENEVVCFDKSDAPYLGQDSFTIHTLGETKTPWRYNDALIPWLLANFKKYDVVIVHGLWLYHSHAAIKAILSYRKHNSNSPKIYIMPHGMLDPYFQRAEERKFKALRNKLYWKFIENKVVNEVDGILFTCEEELLLARTTFPNYKPKNEINVGYGIQPPPIYNAGMKTAFSAGLPSWNGEPYLLFLSRIHPKKGVDLFIKAYLRLEKELEQLPQLVIAGPENHAYGKEMQALAAASDNILFAGMLSGDAKWGAFYESQCFVLPSHQENFGIAVVEALACAKPVLISNKVNIWREIEKENGGIVKEDTEEETCKLLKQWLVKNDVEKTEMAAKAFTVYQEYFTIAQAAQQFLKGIKS
ncbi:glycosyltransferase [Zobellia nedashkovskayae]|uniref:glycosyltransferase n=1 Tax=Zobellia nedashkovskayae TaxID=2779510 RepID=UPI00188D129E|nr:glycosyltransferase [Zobellia nedashkovskayae]